MEENKNNLDPEELAKNFVKEAEVVSLGKSQTYQKQIEMKEESKHIAMEMGYKNVPLEELPSTIVDHGIVFYPEGTQIAIRAATVAEIRHFSGIDENDQMEMLNILNHMIEKCVRIYIPGQPATYKDIKEIDRFYLLLAIKEYTFLNGENKIEISVKDSNGGNHKIELKRELLDYFNPGEIFIKNFDQQTKSFLFKLKSGEQFHLYLPSLGVMNWINNWVKDKTIKKEYYNKSFIKYAPFLFPDWKFLNEKKYLEEEQKSLNWSYQKLSVIDRLIDEMGKSINTNINYVLPNGEEGSAPINFPGGIKSLFIISNISGELL
jgi:hypothetical protein